MSDRRRPIQGQSAGKKPRPAKVPRAKAVLTHNDRFYKAHLFTNDGYRLLREHKGRGAGLAPVLWMLLWDSEDAESGTIHRGRRWLCARLGADSGQLHHALKLLEKLGFIKVVRKGRPDSPGKADGEAAIYQLFGYPPDKGLPKYVRPKTGGNVLPGTVRSAGGTYCPEAKDRTAQGQSTQGKTPTVSSPHAAGAAGLRPAVAGLRPDGTAFQNPKAARAVLSALLAAGPAGLHKSDLLVLLRGAGVIAGDSDWEAAVFEAVEYRNGDDDLVDIRPDGEGFFLTDLGERACVGHGFHLAPVAKPSPQSPPQVPAPVKPVPTPAPAPAEAPAPALEGRLRDVLKSGPAVADQVVQLLRNEGHSVSVAALRTMPFVRVWKREDGSIFGREMASLLRTAEPSGNDPAEWVPYVLERCGRKASPSRLRIHLAEHGIRVTDDELAALLRRVPGVDVGPDPASDFGEEIVTLLPRSRSARP